MDIINIGMVNKIQIAIQISSILVLLFFVIYERFKKVIGWQYRYLAYFSNLMLMVFFLFTMLLNSRTNLSSGMLGGLIGMVVFSYLALLVSVRFDKNETDKVGNHKRNIIYKLPLLGFLVAFYMSSKIELAILEKFGAAIIVFFLLVFKLIILKTPELKNVKLLFLAIIQIILASLIIVSFNDSRLYLFKQGLWALLVACSALGIYSTKNISGQK